MSARHFLRVDDLTTGELVDVLDHADQLKASRGTHAQPLAGRSVGMLFERPSTRTRVSFEVAIAELGATPVVMTADELQLGRGETIEDTARVLSRYVHALVVRTSAQSRLETLAGAGTIPVVNALSDFAHPCQALADLQTVREYKGTLAGLRLAYLGDGNNVAHSLLTAGAMVGMHVAVATPPGYEPIPQVVQTAKATADEAGGSVLVTDDALEAAAAADVVYTDVWASMGRDSERESRAMIFQPYRVGSHVMEAANPDAIVMHCLPAHRDEEIAGEILDGEQSVVWVQAENRLHTAKAVLDHVMGVTT